MKHTSFTNVRFHNPDLVIDAGSEVSRGAGTDRRSTRLFGVPQTRRLLSKSRGGFTLIEVLATLLLMAIVLPAIDLGFSSATRAANSARHRTEASGLAQSKLSELIMNGTWQGGQMAGDFGTDWPTYRWQATVTQWANDPAPVGMQQLDVMVVWTDRGQQQSVTVSGLVYVRPEPTSS